MGPYTVCLMTRRRLSCYGSILLLQYFGGEVLSGTGGMCGREMANRKDGGEALAGGK